ncbi:hypothetical protein HYPSUDRAFT_48924 [Hypholoma sublateritium FD-334 SS-4]|uniref:Uncharacterized protein n=1 Tax=Hypholoma sublateritium (strain FD-334 SS-4) TaxID=945553 RepID=A0A0D2LV76_HYPSF|nr:hypothetical protein HYPSUDRAFT_48924 [Hypholoma sublateritium FD-334 SS-4]
MSDLAARFQPYILSILDSHSSGRFASRQLVTFASRHRKNDFILFLRVKCNARRRGDWATVPGSRMMNKALEYAERHGSYVFNLPLKYHPSARRCIASDDCDVSCAGSDEEDVVEVDIRGDGEDF